MKNFSLALILVFLTSTCLAKELPMKVWQLHDYNMPHIKRIIDMAAEQNVNRIQLSHDIVMFAEETLRSPRLATDINQICKWAHEKDIEVDFWTHELSGIPPQFFDESRRVKLEDPELWAFIQDKYKKVFEACPVLMELYSHFMKQHNQFIMIIKLQQNFHMVKELHI
ncbi:MAG: hypothetical protein SNJ70_08120 [Armatimonadota bacterium]